MATRPECLVVIEDWGSCTSCQQFTLLEACDRCETCFDAFYDQIMAEEAAKPAAQRDRENRSLMADTVAILRPKGVVVGDNRDIDDHASWDVPDTKLTKWGRLAAEAIAKLASRRLRQGWNLDDAITDTPIGRKQLAREMGCSPSTARRGLLELVDVGMVDRTDDDEKQSRVKSPTTVFDFQHTTAWWYDLREHEQRFDHARRYRLNIRFRQLGALAIQRITALSAYAALVSRHSQRRIRGCLRWAQKFAAQGSRNSIGHWLACRCLELRLDLTDAQKILSGYQRLVPSDGHAYTRREATSTLRSVYRARERTCG